MRSNLDQSYMNRSDSFFVKMSVLLVQPEDSFGQILRENLMKEGYEVVGPVNTVAEAYLAILDKDPDMAILDQKVCQDQTEIMSDTLIQIGIEHLVHCHNPPHILKREIGHGAMRGVVMAPHKNTAEGISHELCYMRAEKIRRETERSTHKVRAQNSPL